jgi:hypothetical protein
MQKYIFKKNSQTFCSSLFLKLFVLASKLTHPIFLEKGWLCVTWGYDLQEGYIGVYIMHTLIFHDAFVPSSLGYSSDFSPACALPFFFPSPPNSSSP